MKPSPVRSAVAIAILLALTAVAAAQPTGRAPRRERTPIPTEGFWPTKVMMERIFDRMTEDVARQYEMDDDQRERTAALLKDRIIAWLDENRGEIQSLTNEFLETQFNNAPPTPEAVAKWSQRVLPLVEEFSQVAEDITESMAEYLTDDQVVKLEGDRAAFQTGVTFATNKLRTWSEGHYDPKTEWFSHGPAREEAAHREAEALEAQMDAAQAQAQADAQAQLAEAERSEPRTRGPAKAAVPKDEWTKYTEDFIRKYDLNEEQRQKAMSMLHDRQVERDTYLRRKGDEIEKATQLAADAQTDEERAHARQVTERLNAPVERMFTKLKEGLMKLPTRLQRVKAEGTPDAGSRPAPTQPQTRPDDAP